MPCAAVLSEEHRLSPEQTPVTAGTAPHLCRAVTDNEEKGLQEIVKSCWSEGSKGRDLPGRTKWMRGLAKGASGGLCLGAPSPALLPILTWAGIHTRVSPTCMVEEFECNNSSIIFLGFAQGSAPPHKYRFPPLRQRLSSLITLL